MSRSEKGALVFPQPISESQIRFVLEYLNTWMQAFKYLARLAPPGFMLVVLLYIVKATCILVFLHPSNFGYKLALLQTYLHSRMRYAK